MERTIDAPRVIPEDIQADAGEQTLIAIPGPVFAMAGIANPHRFFDDLRQAGWHLVGTRMFADHYRFSMGDITDVLSAAQSAGAKAVLTTEKDLVRLPQSRIPNPQSRSCGHHFVSCSTRGLPRGCVRISPAHHETSV